MPGLVVSSRSSSSGSYDSNLGLVDSEEYAAALFPGYAEQPLENQLEPIAVIAMGCRLPGDVGPPAAFWDVMMSKRTGQIPKVPASHFNIDARYHKNNVRLGSFGVLGGYFLDSNLSEFDPGLFGITPIEAMWMDPTWTAVSEASFTADWQQMAFKEASFRHSLSATGVDPGIISNRISHVFNLNEPSIMCNAACSSSVYALHNACNALRNREAEGAIVGGVNLIITVDQHMNTAKLGVLSPTSTCHTFDANADRYERADAVGAVYMKRLSDALRDGNPIRGVIRSSATNSNGNVPGNGITHPNRTEVGDPLEVHAVSMAMNQNRTPGSDDPLWIGAVKTNIGHSGAASGLSALIKGILMVERGAIPAVRGHANPNPTIKWDERQVRAPTEAMPFPAHLPVRRVSINSFGHGAKGSRIGTSTATTNPTSITNIQVLAALQTVVTSYPLIDLSYTLATRRSTFPMRAFTVASHSTLEEAFSKVSSSFSIADGKKNPRATPPTVGFVFTGQGAQWARMGAELIEYSAAFRKSIRMLDAALGELRDGPAWPIEDTLLEGAETSRVQEAEFLQPLCTAVQMALVQLLENWGVHPVVTVGHSSGEMAAAYAAGLVSAREAITLAYYRGVVTNQNVQTKGAMMAIGLGVEAIAPYLAGVNGKVVVACHNSPAGVTVSGGADAIDEVQAKLDAENVFARVFKTNGKAYHSPHMTAASASYEAFVRGAKAYRKFDNKPLTTAQMVSSVTNSAVDPVKTTLNKTYWSANLRIPVLFKQAVQTILTADQFADVDLVEVGPHSAMAGPIKQIKKELGCEKLEYLLTPLRGEDTAMQMLKLAGALFLRGASVNMERVSTANASPTVKPSIIVDLPPYQWNYARPFWAESRASRDHRLYHTLGGEVVFPAAGYFAMAIKAVTQLHELDGGDAKTINSYVLRDISIQKALVVPHGDDSDTGIEVLINVRQSVYESEWWDFSVSSNDGEGIKKEHMVGSVSTSTTPNKHRSKVRDMPVFPQRASGKEWNQAFREVGFDYGTTFQDIDDIRFDGKRYQAVCTTNIKQELSIAAIYAGHTGAMDAGIVPIQVDGVTVWPPSTEQPDISKAAAYAWIDKRGIFTIESSAQMTSSLDDRLVLEIINLRCVKYEAAVPQKAPSTLPDSPFGEIRWDVNLALFKYPSWNVLQLGTTTHEVTQKILDKNPRAVYTLAVNSDEEVARVKASLSEIYPRLEITKLDLFQEEQTHRSSSLDIPGGYLVVDHMASHSSLQKSGFEPIFQSNSSTAVMYKSIVDKKTNGYVIISSASSLLWFTAGGLLGGKPPELAMVSGLARTITSEQASLDFRTVDVELGHFKIGGVVTRIGEGASLSVGDRVVGFHADKFSNYQQVPESLLYKLGPVTISTPL
ncbi:acyl transferase domain-containing protein [Podospora didyma]|uniref:Acyl transferase domain-containing protein n=1 Tax=Podospora didyma TaxID=330526 RepID=A0AAE0NBS0_9PEZI|nr:acyl transferase domain-containing protein [Podospora didyma]